MKRFSRIFLSLALVVVLALPMLAGCSLSDLFGGKAEKKVAEINTTSGIRTTYTAKEEIDFQNAKLKITYEDGTTNEITLDKSMVKGFDTLTFGSKEMVIAYGGAKKTIPYQVNLKLGIYKNTIVTTYLDNQLVDTNTDFNYHFKFNSDNTVNVMREENGVEEYEDDNFVWRYQNDQLQIQYNSIWCDVYFTSSTEFDWIINMPEQITNNNGQTYNKFIMHFVYEV